MDVLNKYHLIKNKIKHQESLFSLQQTEELNTIDTIFDKYNFNEEQLHFLNNNYYIKKLKNLEELYNLMKILSKKREKHPQLMEDIMRFWAEITGTAEDELIADELLFKLLDNKHISKEDFNIYDSYKSVNRWR